VLHLLHFWVTNQDWDISLPLVILQSAASEFQAFKIPHRLLPKPRLLLCSPWSWLFLLPIPVFPCLCVTIHSPFCFGPRKSYGSLGKRLYWDSPRYFRVFVTGEVRYAFRLRLGIVRYSLSLTMFSLLRSWWKRAHLGIGSRRHDSAHATICTTMATTALQRAPKVETSSMRCDALAYGQATPCSIFIDRKCGSA